ncbi:hypothetical protein EPUS_03612 [Endocarpon pusillum Z07020]|uniref:IMP-specific 5'-nucleotidase 1 n=1 Tax=Endocarpon pusillum (strain Z07020 / HMAS-L-300199) TaxID=1263415 RepID=U1HHJ8_ENDPU|nr:uncharacterized protein EPUS_03612 [Endocarpon pusillum Z07020]ERF69620.1 hypothetical protein EPUS_03612 [Endocarpon pusillum Z07020]
MTTRYRVEYALKTHRRDQFNGSRSVGVFPLQRVHHKENLAVQIPWLSCYAFMCSRLRPFIVHALTLFPGLQGLLAVPFVLNSQPTAAYEEYDEVKSLQTMAQAVHRRYAEIMRDVEGLVNDHSRSHVSFLTYFLKGALSQTGAIRFYSYCHIESAKVDLFLVRHQSLQTTSKLKMLVPSIGSFFTPLHLEAAFIYQDKQRAISSRRFVAPSFNDVRLILNTAQIMALMRPSLPSSPSNLTANPSAHTSNPPAATTSLQLLTFDGDVTLYDDGASLLPTNPVIPRLIHFLSRNVRIGIVTAAGYTDASRYHARLHGLLDAIKASPLLTTRQKHNLIVMGGESNFLFVFDETSPSLLRYIHRRDWILPAMHAPPSARASAPCTCLPASILRKERAVGIYPSTADHRFAREQLEETVLVVQQVLELSPEVRGAGIPFCAFNGGNDVFVDIGDKSLGVRACQKWFGGGGAAAAAAAAAAASSGEEAGPVREEATLHVGDQFLSGGGNDFKARLACTTAWIASPQETVALLDEMSEWEGVGVGVGVSS